MGNDVVTRVKRDHIENLLDNGKRADGRDFMETRELKISRGIIRTAEGSARADLGGTSVIVGIKIEVGEPYPDKPDQGVLMVHTELRPMASPNFESGPPGEDAIELARVVDRGIRESEVVNLDKLCIVEGEKVWKVYIDMHVLDYDGNLFDACFLGVLMALDNTVVPGTRYDAGPDVSLIMQSQPVSVTMAKIGPHMIVDPDLDEEKVADARITVTTDENEDIRAIQKGSGTGFTPDEVKEAVEISIEVGKKIRNRMFSLGDVVG